MNGQGSKSSIGCGSGTAASLDMHVHYGFVYLESGAARIDDIIATRAGQTNGLCGAAFPGALAMTTGLHTGTVPFAVAVYDEEPPLTGEWEDVVEVSFEALQARCALTTFDDSHPLVLPAASTYRARYCAIGMDAANEQDTRAGDEPVVDRYLLQLWPAPAAADMILREGSAIAAYWHGVARDTRPAPAPPTPAELAAAAGREAEERARQQQEFKREWELRRWGGRLPSDALRACGNGAAHLAMADRALADQLADLDPATQRQVTHWVATYACELAGDGPLAWGEALRALERSEALPGPFDDPRGAWAVLYSPLQKTVTVAVAMTDPTMQGHQPIHPPAAALATVLAASSPHPGGAVFGAIAQACSALEDPSSLYSALRERFGLS